MPDPAAFVVDTSVVVRVLVGGAQEAHKLRTTGRFSARLGGMKTLRLRVKWYRTTPNDSRRKGLEGT